MISQTPILAIGVEVMGAFFVIVLVGLGINAIRWQQWEIEDFKRTIRILKGKG